jgi:GTP-binding protein
VLPARVTCCRRQVANRPPTFAIYANRDEIPETYTRFLVNSLREEFGFLGVPIRIQIRGQSSNPFGGKKKPKAVT